MQDVKLQAQTVRPALSFQKHVVHLFVPITVFLMHTVDLALHMTISRTHH